MTDILYYFTGFATFLTLPTLLVGLVVFLANPKLLNKYPRINNPVSRRKIAAVGVTSIAVAFLTFGSVLAATEPASVKQARAEQEAATVQADLAKQKAVAEASKPVTKIETKTEVIPFDSTEQNDATLPLGQKTVATLGANGERTITYEVTYTSGKETARKETKNEITKQPVTQVTKVGTYVTPTPAPSISGNGYTNVDGNHVASPSSDPTGATVQCGDGTYSYSQHRQGTCSHHGGVARWL